MSITPTRIVAKLFGVDGKMFPICFLFLYKVVRDDVNASMLPFVTSVEDINDCFPDFLCLLINFNAVFFCLLLFIRESRCF